MGIDVSDLSDVRLARPVAIVDLWAIDDRVARLEIVLEKLERAVRTLLTLYHEERVKTWELILQEMMRQRSENDGRK